MFNTRSNAFVVEQERGGGRGRGWNARYIGLAFGGGGEGATQMQVNLHFSFKKQPLNIFSAGGGRSGGGVV